MNRKNAAISVLLLVSLGHLLNDMFQAVIPSIYPMIKESLGLSFMQIGAITLTNQITSSLLQPVVGYLSDKHPRPYRLVVGMPLWVSVPRCFIQSLQRWHGWHQGVRKAWRSPYSR